ncbi:MAG: carbohydrate ABC transporter permease [Caldilinea sp. CFX5]|nr:carbohydrate ABC transporter permease [Caldilinea sp. CFX5]
MSTVALPRAQTASGLTSRTRNDRLRNLLVYGLLIILSLLFLFPFYWMILSGLKPEHKIFVWPPEWIPNPPMWSNFVDAFANPLLPFHIFFRNTLIIEVGMITGRLISCVLIAYAFARLEAPGKDALFAVLLATLMLPDAVYWIPRFILFSNIGWVDTFLPMIVPAWFGEAYAIFLMRQFFMSIPRELEEAANMDGAGTVRVIWNLIVPLSVPVLTVITILSFKDIWNDLRYPLLYLNSVSKYTVAVGLAYFNGQFDVKMNLLMAATVVCTLPVVIVFFIAQRAFVEGISMTGIK